MIRKGTPLVLALGMLFASFASFASFGSYAADVLATIVTMSVDGSGASFSAAQSDAYSHVYNQCLLAHGSPASGVSYLTISQPSPGHGGQWVVRATMQCSVP